MDEMLLLVAIGALLLGGLFGWLIFRADADRFKAAIRDLADEVAWREKAELELARLQSQSAERDRAHAVQLAQLNEAKDALTAQFREVGDAMLKKAQEDFIACADVRFKQSEESAGHKLTALLQPVSDTLKKYDDKLGEIEKARVGSYAELNKSIADLTSSNDVVRREAARLANVMTSSPKARGRWGEQHLQNILELAGLVKDIDFSLQTSVSDGESQLRPDFIIHLPGDRCIVIDVKFPLVHFEAAFNEEDENKRVDLLKQHASSLRSYASDLGKKGYWQQFEKSPEFVIMFVPGEHFLSAAAERAPELIEGAFKNGVIISSTINMLALAKIMAGMWRQERLMGQAQEIAALGKELHNRLFTMGKHVAKVGQNLQGASVAYNAFVSSLDRNVLSSAKKFETLNIQTDGKTLETPRMIEPTIAISAKLGADPAVNDTEE